MAQTSKTKLVKKKFFQVRNDLTGKEMELYGENIESLNGRFVKLDLTRAMRGKGVEVRLKIKVKDNEAYAEPSDLFLLNYFIRRMIRTGTDYVEDSISCPCKNADIVIKPFIITRKKVPRSVRNSLRLKTREWIVEKVKNYDHWELFDEILKNHFQKELSLALKKIYPLSLCEIRVLNIVKVNAEVEFKKPEKEIIKEEFESEGDLTKQISKVVEESKEKPTRLKPKKKTEETVKE